MSLPETPGAAAAQVLLAAEAYSKASAARSAYSGGEPGSLGRVLLRDMLDGALNRLTHAALLAYPQEREDDP